MSITKRELERCAALAREADNLRERMIRLRAAAEGAGMRLDGVPSGGVGDPVGEAVANLDKLRVRWMCAIDQYLALMIEKERIDSMPIELATQYLPYVDEMFATESKKSLLTNQDFAWDGAATVKVYKVSTASMNDYGRSGPAEGNWSRYGQVLDLDTSTETLTLERDRAFTFAIDKLDEDETKRQMQAATALARQLREVVMPEVDAWVYAKMCADAGNKPAAKPLTATNIYAEIIKGSNALDNAEVPDTGRVLLITPDTYLLMKQAKDIVMETDIGAELRLRGVISDLDGMTVIRVPANRVPANFGFLIVHPVATVAPTKLADYRIHQDPPGISGSLVEGRVNYDAFVLENKAGGLYYQAVQ